MGLFQSNTPKRVSPWAVWRAAIVLIATFALVATASATDFNITVDSSQTFQTIDGFGVNANHRSFTNNEIKPVLDALIDQAGMTLFRVVYDNADWEATNDNNDAHSMNWSYYNTIYSSPDFQKMWDMMAYLNQKGITNGVMPNFQGFAPTWMGGFSLTPGFEDEWAEMITSALVYARKTNHLQFTLVAPNNEPDLPGTGVGIADGHEYALTLHKLSQQLDANGMSDIRFVGPDRSESGTNWLPEIMSDPLVMSRLAHFGLHSYSDYGTWSYGVDDFIKQSAYPNSTFWMTEYNVWCETCQASIAGTNSWDYAFGSAEYLLYHLANNATAGLLWEAYDSHYFNNFDSNMHWSYWGLFAVNDINAASKTYTARKAYYTVSQISRFVRPGTRRIAVSGTDSTMLLLAFYHPDTKQVTLTGINYSDNGATLTGDLSSLPGIENLDLYFTTASTSLFHAGSVAVTNGTFFTQVPGYSVFTLTGYVPASITILTQPTNQVVKLGGATTLSVEATGTSTLKYQWQRNKANIAGATNSWLTLTNVKPTSVRSPPNSYRVIITSTAASLTSSNAVVMIDQKNPTVSFTSPKAAARLTNGVATVTGRAGDDTQITGVFYQINGSDWAATSGTSNWLANVDLVAGSNFFRAYAVDAVGNKSSTNSLGFTYVVNSPLTLVTNGLGGITGKTNGTMLEIGKVFTVTAVPGPGQVFSNWVGGVSSGNAALSFVMQSNLVLQANFIPNPFLAATGTYYGLFYETNRVHDHSGFFTLTLGASGGYSARFQVGTTSYSTSGKFNVAGTVTQTVSRSRTTLWTLTMALDLAGAQLLTGTVGDGKWLADLTAERAVFNSATNPATQYAGKYNVMIPGGDHTGTTFPEGDGYCTVQVDSSGKVTLGGSLADSAAIAQAVPLSGAGDVALYVPLYSGKGSLLSWLSFDTNQPAGGLTGWMSWIRPAQRTTLYPAGFTNVVFAGGSRYTAPIGNTNQVIPLTNGMLILEGGNLTTPVTNLFSLSASNKITDGSLSNKLTLSVTASNGVFKGSITPAGTTRALPIQGAIYQDLGAGYGYAPGTNQSSRVFLGQ